MAKANNKLSKTINPKEARQLWIDAALIRAYLADASEAIAPAEFESLLVKSQINPAALDAPGARIPCLLYTSPSPRDRTRSRMPSSA